MWIQICNQVLRIQNVNTGSWMFILYPDIFPSWIPDHGSRILDLLTWISSPGSQIPDIGSWIQQQHRRWYLYPGCCPQKWAIGSGGSAWNCYRFISGADVDVDTDLFRIGERCDIFTVGTEKRPFVAALHPGECGQVLAQQVLHCLCGQIRWNY